MNKGKNTAKGITLIALVITIIVMLILVAVTINIALNGGLFGYAKDATTQTKSKMEAESQLASGRIKIGDVWYDSPQDYADDKPSADQTDGGSGSSTGGGTQNPTQEYTWEKYSFELITVIEANEDHPYWSTQNYSLYNLVGNITAYAHVNFDNKADNFTLNDSWTGNYQTWLYNEYKNYPFSGLPGCYVYQYIPNSVVNMNNQYTYSAKVHFRGYGGEGTISKGSYKYGEVQSTDPTAYPQDGFKDGYWYVLKQS